MAGRFAVLGPRAPSTSDRGSASARSTSPPRRSWSIAAVRRQHVRLGDRAGRRCRSSCCSCSRTRCSTARCGGSSRGRSPTPQPDLGRHHAGHLVVLRPRGRGACSAATGSPCCSSSITVIPASSAAVLIDMPARRDRARPWDGRVPAVRRRVPVRPVLLRDPGVGDRRGRSSASRCCSCSATATRGTLSPVPGRIAVAAVTARTVGLRRPPAVDPQLRRTERLASAASRRRRRRGSASQPGRRRGRRAVGVAPRSRPVTGAPLPQPPVSDGRRRRSGRARRPARQDLGGRDGRPVAPTRSVASTSCRSGCANAHSSS